MPNRIIKESVCTSDTVDQLTWFEECLFYRLIVNCDDYGRMDARPAIIRGKLFPLRDITNKQVDDAIIKLSKVGIAMRYIVDGRPYLQLCTWARHQSIRARKSKYPDPPDICDSDICMHLSSDECKCSRNPIQSESNPNANTSIGAEAPTYKSGKWIKPAVDELRAYCDERKNGIDAQAFYDHYEANGWMVGRTHMKDWRAAVRTWERRAFGGAAAQSPAKRGREIEL